MMRKFSEQYAKMWVFSRCRAPPPPPPLQPPIAAGDVIIRLFHLNQLINASSQTSRTAALPVQLTT